METEALPEAHKTIVQNPNSWLLITHQRPDTDALACLWVADRFIVPKGVERKVMLVESGDHVDAEDDVEVLHMDVGGGPCDQHGKRLERASSFQLVLAHHGITDPALWPILELTLKTDNVEEVEPTSIHYVFKGLPFAFREQGENAQAQVIDTAYLMLDIIYEQECRRIESRERFKKSGRMQRLSNGLALATVFCEPSLREAAFESGAGVVMWTQRRGKDFEVGIQVGRNSHGVTLRGAMRSIRLAEARKRGIELTGQDFGALGTLDSLPGWFLHDSDKLILSGSRTRRLRGDEFTKLTPSEILMAIKEPLSRLRG